MKNVAEGNFSDEEIKEEPTDINIVKKKQILLKPMDDEEACMQLDMIGHSFFIYAVRDDRLFHDVACKALNKAFTVCNIIVDFEKYIR